MRYTFKHDKEFVNKRRASLNEYRRIAEKYRAMYKDKTRSLWLRRHAAREYLRLKRDIAKSEKWLADYISM